MLLLLSLALAWWLDQELNTALSFAIVGALWGIAMAILIMLGRNHARKLEGLPVTRETLKEDMEWARQQKS
jgi:positive regulator of sigma E activity